MTTATAQAEQAWLIQQRLAEGFTRKAWRLMEQRRRYVAERMGDGGRLFIPASMTGDWALLLRQYFVEVAAAFYKVTQASLPRLEGYAAKALPDPIRNLINPIERHSRVLARHEDAGLEVDLEAIIQLHGRSGPGQQKALEKMFDGWKASRVPAIAVTESTKVGNLATWATIRSRGDVRYLRFRAIRDKRTTYTCRMRDGKVLPMDGALLRFNTPPLHHSCRSMLVPLMPGERPSKEELDFPNDDLSRPQDGFGQLLI